MNVNPVAVSVGRSGSGPHPAITEVLINNQSIGRGFVPEAMVLEPFKEHEVRSRFNINYFDIPGAVKRALDEDEMDAVVRGTFYVKGRSSTRSLPYEAVDVIPLGKADQAGSGAGAASPLKD